MKSDPELLPANLIIKQSLPWKINIESSQATQIRPTDQGMEQNLFSLSGVNQDREREESYLSEDIDGNEENDWSDSNQGDGESWYDYYAGL